MICYWFINKDFVYHTQNFWKCFETYNWFYYKMKHMFSYIFTESAPRPIQSISCNAREDSGHIVRSFDSLPFTMELILLSAHIERINVGRMQKC